MNIAARLSSRPSALLFRIEFVALTALCVAELSTHCRELLTSACVSLIVPPAVARCATMPRCHRIAPAKSVLARPVEITAAFGGR
jgi:hypothetical protein